MKFANFYDLQLFLVIDGSNVAEYDDKQGEVPDIDPRIIWQTKYVEATSGANFAIKLHMPHQPYLHAFFQQKDILCRVHLDGKAVVAKFIPFADFDTTHMIEGRILYGPDGVSTLQRSAFAELDTKEDAVEADRDEVADDLGTIRLDLYRVWEVRMQYVDETLKWDGDRGGDISEKALKGRAISNRATFTKPDVLEQPRGYYGFNYKHDTLPFLSAKYKYGSRRDLQIEGVIARSPSPVPLEERDLDDLAPHEARELISRLRRQIMIKKEVKQESRPCEPAVTRIFLG